MSKYLTLLLILSLSLPPLQAGTCEMEQGQANQPPGQHLVMDSDPPMTAKHEQKAAMSDDMPDCCDADPASQNQDCGDTMDCGSCSAFASVIGGTGHLSSQLIFSYSPSLRTGEIVPSHSYPPYRPPIS